MLKNIVLVLGLLLFAPLSHGFFQLGSDFSLRGAGILTVNLKAHSYLFFGGEGFSAGPVFYFQTPYAGFTEVIYGGGIKIGNPFFVELDVGVMSRKVFGTSGKGIAGAVILGYHIGDNFQIVFPFMMRQMTSGLSDKWSVHVAPYLGFRFGV